VVGGLSLNAWATPASAINTIQSLRLEQKAKETRLVLQGAKAVQYNTYMMGAPARLVLDLHRANVKSLRSSYQYANGPIRSIRTRQFSTDGLVVGRLMIALASGTTWKVTREGTQLVIAFRGAKRTAKAKGNVVWRTGRKAGRRGTKARRLLALRVSSKRLRLRLDGAVRGYELMGLRRPARLVLDIHQLRRASFRSIRRQLRRVSCEKGSFRRVRLGRHHNKLRVVLDMCKGTKLPKANVRLTRRGMVLTLANNTRVTKHFEGPAQPKTTRTAARITDIGLGETATYSNVLLQIKGSTPTYRRNANGTTVTLLLKQTTLAKRLQRSLNTSDFQGAVKSITAQQRGKDAQIVVTLKQHVTSSVKQSKSGLSLRFAMPKQAQPRIARANNNDYQIQYHAPRVGQAGVGGGLSASDVALMQRRKGRKRYTGRRISIFFRKVEIHNLLRLFAEISGMNVITSGNVKGRVTLKLRNVPWDQALDLVLKTLKLGMEKSGNIVRIATLEELRQEEQQRRRLQQLKLLAQPQKIRILPVNYAKAQQMQQKVKTVLSPRGKVTIDTRTNVLIVKDYVPFLLRAEGLIRQLDTQTPQVLIQARIVEANVNFAQEFGIQWGGHLLFSPLTGNSTGLQFPNPVGIRGGVPAAAGGGGAQQGTGEFGTPNYVINFPATTGLGNGTALSFLFGSLSGIGQLAMRLSAAESTGNVKIISAPKIITLHKMSASIQQGLQIPFSSASAAGTNVQFVQASLSLTVTPQVTSDGSVFLQLNITNNAPDFSKGGAAGPAITTKTAQTNMLIKDGETMVIGGIYSRRTGESQSRVPFLSKIPVLGLLFKNYKYNDDRAELLVFVTPRIVNRAKTLIGKQGS
jgi:type IV pilus assembly protein PilQ